MKKYGVIGYPLAHSLSPLIHNFVIKQLQLDASYEKIEIVPAHFEETISQLLKSNIAGFNVTIPFKEKIIPFVDEIDKDAIVLGAVNTLKCEEGKWRAYNTDVPGFIAPLKELNDLIVKKCLVLGAGGASRAVIYALGRYFTPLEISIAARNKEKARKLSDYFAPLIKPTKMQFTSIEAARDQLKKFDLIINATPLGTYPNIDQSPLPGIDKLAQGSVVYDVVYNPIKTRLLKEAEISGRDIVTINGMKMLLAQAAEAFRLWTGKTMPVGAVEQYLKDQKVF